MLQGEVDYANKKPVKDYTLTNGIIFSIRDVGYQPQWIRPNTIDATERALAELSQVLTTSCVPDRLSTTKAATVSGLSGITSQPIAAADIPNGWTTKRLILMLYTQTEYLDGTRGVEIIQAYSEHADQTFKNTYDDNMLFYINTVTTILITTHPVTGEEKYNLMGTYTVHGDNDTISSISDKCLSRPNDIYTQILANSSNAALDNYGYTNDGYGINKPLKTAHTGELGSRIPHLSNTVHTSPVHSVSETVSKYLTAANATSFGSSVTDIVDEAISTTATPTPNTVLFIRALSSVLGGFLAPTKFSWNTLKLITPNIVNNIIQGPAEIGVIKNTHMVSDATVLDSDITQDKLQPTIENIKAQLISTTMIGIAAECAITRYTVTISNNWLSATPQVFITDAGTFLPANMLPFLTGMLKDKIENVLWPVIGSNGLMDIKVTIHGCVTDTTLLLSVNNGPEILYRDATFASNTYTPLINSSLGRSYLTEEYANVIGAIQDIKEAFMANQVQSTRQPFNMGIPHNMSTGGFLNIHGNYN